MIELTDLQAVRIDSIEVRERARKDLGDIDELAKNIKENGIIQAIVLCRGVLIAGFRRLEAAKRLGWKRIPAINTEDMDEATRLRIEQDENVHRKELTRSERVRLAAKIERKLRDEAKRRQSSGKSADGTAGGRGRKKGNLTESFGKVSDDDTPTESKTRSRHKMETTNQIGRFIGMSGRTYQRAKTVVEAADKDEESYGSIRDEMDRTGKVTTAFDKVIAKQKGGVDKEDLEESDGADSNQESENGRPKKDPQRIKAFTAASDAIDLLQRIPPQNPHWREAWGRVADYIKHNTKKRMMKCKS